MQFIYDFLSAFIIVISVTVLISERLNLHYYIILMIYVMGMVELSSITELGQIVGIVMAPILFFILALFIKVNRIWNLCMGCLGYLLNLTLNNIMLYVVAKIWKVSIYDISGRYWLQFSL